MSTQREQLLQQKNQIFSQEALDKLRSPEKLDTVLPITTPVSRRGSVAVFTAALSGGDGK